MLRPAYDRPPPTGLDAMVGASGRAQDRIASRGFIRVGGELWRAELAEGELPVEAGMPVIVVGHEGSRLRVRHDAERDR